MVNRCISLAACLLLCSLGCGRTIGDDCETNVQCSSRGDRQCDLSQPQGYCTVEGCDQTSCPDDSLCVRFFPAVVLREDHRCNVTTESAERRCSVRETCIAAGYCVEPRLERRFCMKPCTGMSDCRAGYQCQATGQGGAELLPTQSGVPPAQARFCIRVPEPGSTAAPLSFSPFSSMAETPFLTDAGTPAR